MIVAARTSPEKKARGITLFGVEAGMEGFSRDRKLDKVGQPESDTAELFFEDVRVPGANVIGEIDGGFIHMMQWLPQERLGSAVTNIAHAAQILEETVEYARDRKAFGQSIGNSSTASPSSPSSSRRSRWPRRSSTRRSRRTTRASSRRSTRPRPWWSAEVQNDVLDHCVQLYGGYGYMNEYRVAAPGRTPASRRSGRARTRS